MKTFITTLLLLNFSLNGITVKREKINTNKTSMSKKESDILLYINLVRTNPEKFEKEILNPFLKKNKKYSKKYIKSLKKDLKNLKILSPLNYSEKLFIFARHHAKTTGKKGKVGHKSIYLKGYKSRTKKLLKNYSVVGENIHYGLDNPKKIILELLIDDGIKGVGHRKNILSNEYKYASVSIQPHKKYIFNTVIEFGGVLIK